MSTIICYCSNVTEQEIVDAIDNGANSLSDIKTVTGACTVGRCKELHPKGT
ncbi:BFD-like [2Fe-2S] binding domain protein [Andreesenia angusta]|uniref:BFD-like [2Fe-2S] binding domain protein n=1 Tax=Andreesenia angusta TaxID=39480 RepID=A0A1S1VBC0_9FIRM|nr:BFD-like [2Fe-2S] binding domain protein [Andreesenia angusta]